jgi:hypothetical protein
MTKSIEEYLHALKQALIGSDSATIQDALTDAEEHLRTALASVRESNPDHNEADALVQIIEQYGTPEETAAAYVEVERRTFPGLGPVSSLQGTTAKKAGSLIGRFFGIYTDPHAWGGLFYMLIAFVTGVVYFTWAVTGLSLSVSFALFIFGLPVAVLFLLSVQGVAWLEGRLVEALLGIRMPRRRLFVAQNIKLLERIKVLLTDKHTWLSLVYMLFQFVLGTIYFVVLMTVFAISLTGLAIPVLQELFDIPVVHVGSGWYRYVPDGFYPLTVLAGILLWTLTMHLVKWVGGLHGRYAKALLVTD